MPEMEQLGTKPSRRRKWTLDIPREELWMKLRRRTGKPANYRPKRGTEKSTKICLWDIALLARANKRSLASFLANEPAIPGHSTAGQKTLERVNRILDLVNAGLITKSQYGSYHFWTTPQVPPVVTRTINLDTCRISSAVSTPKAPSKMPSFTSVFGERK